MSLKGIDVSAHNGEIDWQSVKNDEIDFAIIRAGYGNDLSQKDKFFDRNMQGAIANGIKIGSYWFSYATSVSDAIAEANICKSVLEPYKDSITWPVFFDYEYDSVRYSKQQGVEPNKTLVTDMAVAFLDTMASAGYKVGNYANPDFCRNWFDMDRMSGYTLWLAQYEVDSPSIKCAMWQFGGTNVSGCSGNIDTNVAYIDLSNGESAPSRNHQTSPSPSTISTDKISAAYRVKTKEDGWLSEVWDNNDYAGLRGHKITGVAIGVTKGSIKYRVHICDGDWLPWVTGYDTNDDSNGYAGDGREIDLVEAYYSTPNGVSTRYAKYRVSPNQQEYYPIQIDDQTGNGMDGFSGQWGNTVDRFQIIVEE